METIKKNRPESFLYSPVKSLFTIVPIVTNSVLTIVYSDVKLMCNALTIFTLALIAH